MPEGHYDIDSYGYDSIAMYFARTGILTDPHQPESAPIQPVGYPFILGLFFKLFGHDVRPVFIAQILLMCVVLVLLMLIAQRIAGDTVARITGMFFLFTPGFYLYPQLLLAETFVVVLILLVCERYLAFLSTGSISALSVTGLCAGISMLVKPVVMLLMIILAGLTWYTVVIQKKTNMKAFLYTLLLCGSFAMPVILYMVRNHVRYGHASFAPMMPLNIYQIFLSKVMATLSGKDPQEIIETTLRFKGAHSLDCAGWDHARTLFYEHATMHPSVCMQIWCLNVLKTWCGLYVSQLKRMIEPSERFIAHSYFMQTGTVCQKISGYVAGGTTKTWINVCGWYECIWLLIRLISAFIGLYFVFKKSVIFGWFFLSVCISLSVPTGIDGCCRYRIIFEPILILLSAIAFSRVYVHLFNKKRSEKYVVWK